MRNFNLDAGLAGLVPPKREEPTPRLVVHLPLRTVTPVIGGGVEPFTPHPWEPVRVPAIRGHLRWWYRALCPSAWSPTELHRDEMALWGGVDDDEAIRSRIDVKVELVDEGKVSPAGHHKVTNGKTKTVSQWEVGARNALAYGLFPLQRSGDDRRQWEREHQGQKMPTRSVREDLRFRLSLSLRPAHSGQSGSPERLHRLLRAVWCWVHLGGIGARTRRGFGALSVDEKAEIHGDGDLTQEARCWFSVSTLEEWHHLARQLIPGEGERRCVYRFLVNHEHGGTSNQHHGSLLTLLKKFRQGVGVGRDQGHGGRPGQSHWPEAHALRVHRGAGNYEHDPPQGVMDNVKHGRQGFPRAAFGLPLEVGFFYQHHSDQQADASVLPYQVRVEGGHGPAGDLRRFASPLLMRPLVLGDRAWLMIVALGGESIDTVRLRWKNADGSVDGLPVQRSAGTSDPIRPALQAANGDAVEAFCDWVATNWSPRRRP